MQTSAEHLRGSGDTQSSTAFTIGAEWRPDKLWQLSSRLEWRKTNDTKVVIVTRDPVTGSTSSTANDLQGYQSWLSTLSISRKLSDDWTLLARNHHLRNVYSGSNQDSWENRFQLGMAFRDVDKNRVNLLGMYQYWAQDMSSAGMSGLYNLGTQIAEVSGTHSGRLLPDNYRGYRKHMASLSADWHPLRPVWVTGKIAGKWQDDIYADERESYDLYYLSGRTTYDLTKRWDVSVLGATMWSPGGGQQYAVGGEAGYLLIRNLWLSAGYNWRGFREDDLPSGEYTNEGAFIRLRYKFDEGLFGVRNSAQGEQN